MCKVLLIIAATERSVKDQRFHRLKFIEKIESSVYQQTSGIHMGTVCAPIVVYLDVMRTSNRSTSPVCIMYAFKTFSCMSVTHYEVQEKLLNKFSEHLEFVHLRSFCFLLN